MQVFNDWLQPIKAKILTLLSQNSGFDFVWISYLPMLQIVTQTLNIQPVYISSHIQIVTEWVLSQSDTEYIEKPLIVPPLISLNYAILAFSR